MTIVLIASALILGLILLNRRTLASKTWRAVVTPLASIIGSGFLVSGPVLAATMGDYAWVGMVLLCLVGYYFGMAVRANIKNIEPIRTSSKNREVAIIEQLSEFSLGFAYFISVSYYLNLFAAFGLRIFGLSDQTSIRIAASVAIAVIGFVGFLGGLDGLEKMTIFAVGLKLSLIGAVLIGLISFTFPKVVSGSFALAGVTHATGWNELFILLGLIVMVQGFETSRYLGESYPADLRIKTMRYSQIISSGIYLLFILLITQFFPANPMANGSETAIVDWLGQLGPAIAPMIIVMALASQFSAAVADTSGAGGLVSETLRGKISPRVGSLITAIFALTLTWSADLYQIITYASKAFVIYYSLQALQASLYAFRSHKTLAGMFYGLGVILGLFVVIFATPAAA